MKKFFSVMILSFWTLRCVQTVKTQICRSSLIRVYTVCHCVCTLWTHSPGTHYSMLKLYCSKLRIITTIEPPRDKTNKMTVRPAKTQISLGIHPVWSESSLCAQWVAKDPSFLHADSEDSDQTGRKPRLIWVFAGCTFTLLVLSCCGTIVCESDSFRSLL